MFSICLHEYAHASIALKQGDPTAAEAGHLTLNPMVQMGGFSIVMLLLIGISWGSVPINPYRMRHRYSQALVSFAGPAANMVLFLSFCLLFTIFSKFNQDLLSQMFWHGAILNIVLFMFNMLPIPILDGWTVFSYLFPKLETISNEIKNGVAFILIIVFLTTNLFQWFFIFGKNISSLVVNIFGIIL